MGYPCPVPQEGRVRERQGPKVSFKRPNSPQQDQGFTDLNPSRLLKNPQARSGLSSGQRKALLA